MLVPGQIISPEILAYLKALDVKEIHGYEPQYGLRVFTQAALDALAEPKAAALPRASIKSNETEREGAIS